MDTEFTRDERRELEGRLAKAQRHIGETCSLELAFGHNSHLYVYEARPDWYDDFLDACDEISSVMSIDDDSQGTEATGSAAVTIPTTSRWIFPVADNGESPKPSHLPPVAAQILYQRGFRDAAGATQFLNPRIEDLHDPFLLRDMDRAVERIRQAIARREPIEIHGDYDVDGVTSTVVLKKALELAGVESGWHIPHRLHDGYGMQPAAVEEAAGAVPG